MSSVAASVQWVMLSLTVVNAHRVCGAPPVAKNAQVVRLIHAMGMVYVVQGLQVVATVSAMIVLQMGTGQHQIVHRVLMAGLGPHAWGGARLSMVWCVTAKAHAATASVSVIPCLVGVAVRASMTQTTFYVCLGPANQAPMAPPVTTSALGWTLGRNARCMGSVKHQSSARDGASVTKVMWALTAL